MRMQSQDSAAPSFPSGALYVAFEASENTQELLKDTWKRAHSFQIDTPMA